MNIEIEQLIDICRINCSQNQFACDERFGSISTW